MLLSIVILNFKKVDLTLSCIQSLYRQFNKEFDESIVELILVDNASGDNSVEVLKKIISSNKYSNVKLVENNENVGFSKGCNIGAKKARGELFLFLNNDTIIEDRGILDMAEYLSTQEDIAILGGLLSNPDGSHQPSVGNFYTPFYTLLFLLGLQKSGFFDKNPNKISQVDWVKGGFLIIKGDILKQLGGFDEKIFMYTEDMELCFRAKQSGYKTFFYPNTSVIHKEHGSANRSFAIINIYKGMLYFYKKHKSKFEYRIVKGLLIAKARIAIAIGKITRNNYLVSTYSQAIKF